MITNQSQATAVWIESTTHAPTRTTSKLKKKLGSRLTHHAQILYHGKFPGKTFQDKDDLFSPF